MSSKEIRPSDPLLRFFQDCLIMEPRRESEDRQTLHQWIEETAREYRVNKASIPTVRKIAAFVSGTPVAFVEVRRKLGFDLAENAAREAVATFVVPAYGDFTEVMSRNLVADGYQRDEASEVRQEEICFFNPETRILVSIRLAGMYPLAQGPAGFVEAVKTFGALLGRVQGDAGGDGAEGEAGPADGA